MRELQTILRNDESKISDPEAAKVFLSDRVNLALSLLVGTKTPFSEFSATEQQLITHASHIYQWHEKCFRVGLSLNRYKCDSGQILIGTGIPAYTKLFTKVSDLLIIWGPYNSTGGISSNNLNDKYYIRLNDVDETLAFYRPAREISYYPYKSKGFRIERSYAGAASYYLYSRFYHV